MYITRPASNEIFSPSNKIHREVGRTKDLPAPRQLVHCCPVCQFVSYGMSHLYCQCQKHKHFGLSNVRFKRGSIIKSLYVLMVVEVSLYHQQSDNICKIQKENVEWTWANIYVWCFIVLLSSGPLCVCVCCAALRARGLCPLQGYWLLSQLTWPTLTCILFLRSTGLNWTAGLGTSACLAVRLRLWHPWHTFRTSLNRTYITWYSCFITVIVNNQFRCFTGLHQPCPLSWSTHNATTHTNCHMHSGKNNKLSVQQWMYSYTDPEVEKWNAILLSCKWGPSKKRMADKGLLIAACHHIIALTLVLCRYTLQTKQSVTHKPDEQSRKNKHWIFATASLLL